MLEEYEGERILNTNVDVEKVRRAQGGIGEDVWRQTVTIPQTVNTYQRRQMRSKNVSFSGLLGWSLEIRGFQLARMRVWKERPGVVLPRTVGASALCYTNINNASHTDHSSKITKRFS